MSKPLRVPCCSSQPKTQRQRPARCPVRRCLPHRLQRQTRLKRQKIAASDQGNSADPTAVDKTPPAASTLVQTERFEAPSTSQMRVIAPAPIETPVTASIPKDQSPVRGSSSTAQTLATLAGAITACIVGWLVFGLDRFGRSSPGGSDLLAIARSALPDILKSGGARTQRMSEQGNARRAPMDYLATARAYCCDLAATAFLFVSASVMAGRIWRFPFDDEIATLSKIEPGAAREFVANFPATDDIHPPFSYVFFYATALPSSLRCASQLKTRIWQ